MDRKKTYVERELHRRRIEKRQRVIDNVVNIVGGSAIILGMEFLLIALFLMSC